MISVISQIKVALTYLLIAAFLGVFLRLFAILDLNATHRFIVHTHSHIALLGWVYVALTTLLFHVSISEDKKRKYKQIFWCTQITIVGMLVTFPFVGYALYSIIFSTLFLVCSYWFFYFFIKNHSLKKASVSYKFIYTSLIFMVVSSIGPWLLGIIMNTLGSTSHWYKNAIYFYLHFQYNGWFIFCLLGLFLFVLEKSNIVISNKLTKSFYNLMLISTILTLFLSFLWVNPNITIYTVAIIGAIIQLIALVLFIKLLMSKKQEIKIVFSSIAYTILKFVLVLLLIKVILQFLSSFPFFVVLTTELIDFVIGYLHLVFLGIITLSIFVLLEQFKLIKISRFWLLIFTLGFIFSECLIFYKGITLWQQIFLLENYYITLVIISALMPIGVLGIYLKTFFFNSPNHSKSA